MDAVYSWVDGSTPRFAHDLQLVCAGAERSAVDVRRRRFRDNGELRYSMRSLVRFAPWLRRIYLVTNGDVPAWLARYSNRVEVVTHAALFDTTDDLPTFNSNAIEMHLHRIPGLSRKFLYLNDDVFFGRPCTLAGFSDGGTDFFLFERQRCPSDSEHGEVHDRAYAYTARRVSVVTGCPLLTRLPAHTPQLYDREAISQLEEQFRAEFQATASHRLRRSTDFVLRIAYAAAGLGAGRVQERVLDWGSSDYTFLSLDDRPLLLSRRLLAIRARRPRFYCLNDDLGDVSPNHLLLRLVRWFLRAYYPQRMPFEANLRETRRR
ncbi:MAG: hypothetical protein A3F90_04185 [Deltaproteobacteria bacterium RIFCSPLOWO2_12_FULL_60_19]|nr:MAG: hypothetical protein A3F90_04185 [Deltaproteobacteria bacterium RIFCSPLOWO2_12_FULL_60_19]